MIVIVIGIKGGTEEFAEIKARIDDGKAKGNLNNINKPRNKRIPKRKKKRRTKKSQFFLHIIDSFLLPSNKEISRMMNEIIKGFV